MEVKDSHNNGPGSASVGIQYDRGTLLVEVNAETKLTAQFPWLVWDQRSGFYRCHAYRYYDLVRHFYLGNIGYSDSAPNYKVLSLSFQSNHKPFDFQAEAFKSWNRTKRGITVLPTGAGKSFLAAMILSHIQRSTLILVPTIDLLLQWQGNLESWFQCPVGLLGGGSHQIEDITVSTYDSARIHCEHLGNRFCLLVFDECHHLPSPAYSNMARAFIAPYRLGLTATPGFEMERQSMLYDLIGPLVYTKQIDQLSGDVLAPYEVRTIEVELTAEERDAYEYHRRIYVDFRNRVPEMVSPGRSWSRFVTYCYRSAEGRRAMRSFAEQKKISLSAENKMAVLADILFEHRDARILVFTHDNKTAYFISTLFLLPLITHETKAKERKAILERFRSGEWPILVNSRVLNEGVDVPEANIAVVISGTSTVREHVQRLGRILRKQKNKKAILYEIITSDTGEVFTSRRRKGYDSHEFPT